MRFFISTLVFVLTTASSQELKQDSFKIIDDQARNTVISVPDGSYEYEQYLYAQYAVALQVCDKQYPDQATTAYWVARISQKGHITISKYIPTTRFMACVDVQLQALTFKQPPSTKFDDFGGYPVQFTWMNK